MLVGQGVEGSADEHRPRAVVGAAGRPCAAPGALHHLAIDVQRVSVEADGDGLRGEGLAVTHGIPQDVDDAERTLARGGVGGVVADRPHAGVHVADRGEQDAGLAEAG